MVEKTAKGFLSRGWQTDGAAADRQVFSRMADGRTHARKTDFCDNDYKRFFSPKYRLFSGVIVFGCNCFAGGLAYGRMHARKADLYVRTSLRLTHLSFFNE